MLNAKKIGVIVVTVAVAGTLMFFGIQAVKNSQVQNTQNNTSIGQIVEDPVNMGTSESAETTDKVTEQTEEEKNIDEAVTTIDEVETDEQGQLAANAGGSGEAEMAETNEKDVYTDMGSEEVPEEEKVDLPETSVNFDMCDPNFSKKEANLPSEEKAEWFDNLIDENNTVLH